MKKIEDSKKPTYLASNKKKENNFMEKPLEINKINLDIAESENPGNISNVSSNVNISPGKGGEMMQDPGKLVGKPESEDLNNSKISEDDKSSKELKKEENVEDEYDEEVKHRINNDFDNDVLKNAFLNRGSIATIFCKRNMLTRITLFSPLVRRSLYNSRFKKMMLLYTELSLIWALLSIFMSLFGNFEISLSPLELNSFPTLMIFTHIAVLVSNLICYLIAIFLRSTPFQRKVIYECFLIGDEELIMSKW